MSGVRCAAETTRLHLVFWRAIFAGALILPMAAGALAENPKTSGGAKSAAATSTSPAAAAKPEQGQQAPAWAVNCGTQANAELACEMAQTIVDQRGQPLVVLSIRKVAADGSKALILRAPHGVYLPAGIAVQIDNGPATKIHFQKSDQNGVYASMPITDKLASEFKAGHELHLNVELNPNQPATIAGQLRGFGPAYDKIATLK